MILPPTSEFNHHRKVTNIKMSPTSLSPDQYIQVELREFFLFLIFGLKGPMSTKIMEIIRKYQLILRILNMEYPNYEKHIKGEFWNILDLHRFFKIKPYYDFRDFSRSESALTLGIQTLEDFFTIAQILILSFRKIRNGINGIPYSNYKVISGAQFCTFKFYFLF